MTRNRRRVRLIAAAAVGLVGIGSLIGITELPANAASAVTVNGGTTYQTIDGFGMSEAFSQANSIRTLGSAAQKQALDMLFSPTTGAGFTILRSIIGSDAGNTMEPNAPSGGPSGTPNYVWNGTSDTTDEGQLWLAKQAKTYGVTNFYNDAWSAPGFMKTNNSEANGGSLCGTTGASCASGDWRQAYANYLVQHAKNWASVGVTPSYVGFTNEPSLTTTYSSMLVNPAQAASFLSVLSPTMKASGLSTKVACCDTLGFNLLPSYVSSVTANANANSDVGMFSSHGYSNAPTSPVSTGGRSLWESEWSINGATFDTAWDDGSQQSGFTWAQHVQAGMTGANLNAFLYWWGISNTSHDSSLIGLNGSTLTPTKRFYALANYSRFIRPGAVRIGATSGDANLSTSAYRNTDGSVVIVALNSASSAISTNYSVSNTGSATGTVTPYLTNASSSTAAQSSIPLTGGTFTASVPARSLVSYRIVPGATSSPSPSASASASPSASASASPSPSVSPSVSPTPTEASPSPSTHPTDEFPTGSPSPSTSPNPGSGCAATYSVDSSWQGGFQATVTVRNNSSAVTNGWTVRWTLPSGQTISQLWNGTLTTSGSAVTVKNMSYNGTLTPTANTTFGYIGTGVPGATATLTCTSP